MAGKGFGPPSGIRAVPLLTRNVVLWFRPLETRSTGTAIPELLTQHSEVTAVRAFSNLSTSRKKSSPLIKQRDLAELSQLRLELRKVQSRFNRKRGRIEGML